MLSFYCVLLAMFGVICKAIQLVYNIIFSFISTQWNDNCEEPNVIKLPLVVEEE